MEFIARHPERILTQADATLVSLFKDVNKRKDSTDRHSATAMGWFEYAARSRHI